MIDLVSMRSLSATCFDVFRSLGMGQLIYGREAGTHVQFALDASSRPLGPSLVGLRGSEDFGASLAPRPDIIDEMICSDCGSAEPGA